MSDGVSRQQLEQELFRRFGGTDEQRRAVARQATDLLDSEQLIEDLGTQPTVPQLCNHLADAPDGYALPERWNWWIGSLELAFGGYLEFRLHEPLE